MITFSQICMQIRDSLAEPLVDLRPNDPNIKNGMLFLFVCLLF